MRLKKTNTTERTTYTYCFTDVDENGKCFTRKQTICPGENRVTELDIKMLHSLDDSEVYYNIKNMRPPMTEAEKAERAEWLDSFKADFLIKNGYEATRDVIEAAVAERYPKNWNLSLNSFESDDDGKDTADRHTELADPAPVIGFDDDVPDSITRLRTIVESLSPQRQAVYRMVMLEKRTKVYAAGKLGISEGQVRKDVKKIERLISEDEVLQKIFR